MKHEIVIKEGDDMEEQKRFEKTSSAEVSTNKKGESSYSVKIYFDVDEKTSTDVVDKLEAIMNELKRRF